MFDVDLFIGQVQKLIQDRDTFYREKCDDICEYCKNKVDCIPDECECYTSGGEVVFHIDGEIESKWDCLDFDYGSCPAMEKTPCFKCFEGDYDGFQYNGTDYDFNEAFKQLRCLCQDLQEKSEDGNSQTGAA